MDIRLATERDLPALMELYGAVSDAMEGTPFDCMWRRDGHPSEELVGGLIAARGMLVGEKGGELVGAAGINHDLGHDYGPLPWLVDVPEREVASLHLLVVREDQRGRGLSRELLRACLREAAEQGMRTVRLDVTENNLPAKELYAREGFSVVGGGTQEIGPDEHPHVWLDVMERVL